MLTRGIMALNMQMEAASASSLSEAAEDLDLSLQESMAQLQDLTTAHRCRFVAMLPKTPSTGSPSIPRLSS
jgi:hypothetical protein